MSIKQHNSFFKEALESLLETKVYKELHGKDITYEWNRDRAWKLAQKAIELSTKPVITIKMQKEWDEIKHTHITKEFVEQRVSSSLLDLDGKMVPVKIKVSKYEPKIIIE